MTQACNPSYLVDGDWKDHGVRPAWEKSSQDSISTGGVHLSSQLWWEAQIGVS
jgi:hypothetical protein